MVPAWIAGVEAQWTEALMQAGRRDEAMGHFARAETDYGKALRLGFAPGPLQSQLGTLYAIVGKPAEAVAAFEAAEAADYLDVAVAPDYARAYIALGRCLDAERVLTKVDRTRGLAGPSRETRAILGACSAPR